MLSCGTLLLCDRFSADIDVYSAVNDAGLVYDGGIVVDGNFCTTDPCIFAAGSCTRFSRVHSGAVRHGDINARSACLCARTTSTCYPNPLPSVYLHLPLRTDYSAYLTLTLTSSLSSPLCSALHSIALPGSLAPSWPSR